jgi:hypothetical protein
MLMFAGMGAEITPVSRDRVSNLGELDHGQNSFWLSSTINVQHGHQA